MFVEHDAITETLYITNYGSRLRTTSLLLGGSPKATIADTIGKFGEGYKLAALVLTRLGKQLTIYNGPTEVWKPRFVDSKRYDARILTFFIRDRDTAASGDCLSFKIEGVSVDDYATTVHNTLRLHANIGECIGTPYGRVLLNPDLRGNIYVSGLFVCKKHNMDYGYDILPSKITIDRDRRIVADFDLQWLTSQMWSGQKELLNMMERSSPDVSYVHHHIPSTQKVIAYQAFKDKYGDNAVPVTTRSEAEALPRGYKPIITSESYRQVIVSSKDYLPPLTGLDELEPLERLSNWFEEIKELLSTHYIEEFNKIFDKLTK
jgi:hypothetical protein